MSNCRSCPCCGYYISTHKPVCGAYHVFTCHDNRMLEANMGESRILEEVPIIVGVSCLKYLSAPEDCPRKDELECENS